MSGIKDVLITGGTRNTGLGIAKAFAAKGYRLHITGRKLGEVEKEPEDFARQAKATVDLGVKALKWDPFGSAHMTIENEGLHKAVDIVTAAHQARASCIVSPNSDERIIKLTKELGMVSIPGAYTPTEIMNAYNWGADIVKIFPILPDEIGYLKNIISPLSHIPFITTGGIRLDNMADFLDCGAVAVAAGVTLVPTDMLERNDFDGIRDIAKKFVGIAKGR